MCIVTARLTRSIRLLKVCLSAVTLMSGQAFCLISVFCRSFSSLQSLSVQQGEKLPSNARSPDGFLLILWDTCRHTLTSQVRRTVISWYVIYHINLLIQYICSVICLHSLGHLQAHFDQPSQENCNITHLQHADSESS